MRVEYQCSDGKLQMILYPTKEEEVAKSYFKNGAYTIPPKMGRHICEFNLPKDWTLNHIHPDSLALATVLIIYPFLKGPLELAIGVSPHFAELFSKVVKKEISPVNPALSKREVLPNAKMSLAYSGGIDSTAILSLIPEDSIILFIDRISDETDTLYDKSAAVTSCNALKNAGRKVYMIPTDFEYVRDPLGFPVDLACGILSLLLSDYEGIDSVAVGMIAEDAYGIGDKVFKNYPQILHHRLWAPLFQAAGVTLSFVTAGISKIATTAITLNSKYASLGQSCIRGPLHQPCMQCYKCLQQSLLTQIINNDTIDDELIKHFFASSHREYFFTEDRISYHNVFLYITSHYKGNYYPMLVFKHRTGGDIINVDWLKKWYPHSIEVVADKYREFVEARILEHLDKMSPEECLLFENWNITDLVESKDYRLTTDYLRALLRIID